MPSVVRNGDAGRAGSRVARCILSAVPDRIDAPLTGAIALGAQQERAIVRTVTRVLDAARIRLVAGNGNQRDRWLRVTVVICLDRCRDRDHFALALPQDAGRDAHVESGPGRVRARHHNVITGAAASTVGYAQCAWLWT